MAASRARATSTVACSRGFSVMVAFPLGLSGPCAAMKNPLSDALQPCSRQLQS